MGAPVFIGDEWTAAGFRLAGARTVVPGPGEVRRVFDAARAAGPPLLLLGADAARELEPALLESAQAALDPPVLVVSPAAGETSPPDLIVRIRRRMGVAE